jgi:hypothetical protein
MKRAKSLQIINLVRISRYGAKRRGTLAGACLSCRLQRKAKRHPSHTPVSLQPKVSPSVPSPGHAPGDDAKNFSRVSSLPRARSSHRANRDRRNPAPAAAAAWAEPKPHGIPASTPKRFSPPPSKKRSRVAALGRTVFNSPRAHPLSPALRSELKTDRP